MSLGLAMRDDWSGRASISVNQMVSATNYSVRRVAVARVRKARECCEARRKNSVWRREPSARRKPYPYTSGSSARDLSRSRYLRRPFVLARTEPLRVIHDFIETVLLIAIEEISNNLISQHQQSRHCSRLGFSPFQAVS